MPIVALLIGLGGIVGLAFIVKEVHEITDDPAFPLIGFVLGTISLIILARFIKGD